MGRGFSCSVALGLVGFGGADLRAQCTPPAGATVFVVTDEYSLTVESGSGAVGDVVGVTVYLRSRLVNRGFIAMEMTLCHDPRVAQPVGGPRYSEDLVSLLGVQGVASHPVNEGAGLPGDQRGHGNIIDIDFNAAAYEARFLSDVPLEMLTVYYRLKGNPGESGALTFCDGVLALYNARCTYNQIYMFPRGSLDNWQFMSRANQGGSLTVLPGPATHPDRPPEPPEARIYPELPPDASVNFRVRIEGASARPGDRDVRVEVHVSADVEYSGILVPIDFDERYLRLARAEDHFLTGVALVDNRNDHEGAGPDEGTAVVFSGMGVNSRRLAAEGEEVHAATLYFDVLEAAAGVASTALSVVPVTDSRGIVFRPWIGVHHQAGVGAGEPIVRSEVAPISIQNSVLLLQPQSLVLRGDANVDGLLDISDVTMSLNALFLGGGMICPVAADYNLDHRRDISDPILLLWVLFLGAPAPSGPERVPCN